MNAWTEWKQGKKGSYALKILFFSFFVKSNCQEKLSVSQAFSCYELRVWTENLVFVTVHVSSSADVILSVIFNLNNICVPDMYHSVTCSSRQPQNTLSFTRNP